MSTAQIVAFRGRSVEVAPMVVIPWPRYPTITAKGAYSKARNAGQLVPWLSANVVNNLAHPVYRKAVAIWRETTVAVAPAAHLEGRYLVLATLYRATGQSMDPFAVLEGLKPVLDGLVVADFLADDSEEHLAGGLARCRKAAQRSQCRLELSWRVV